MWTLLNSLGSINNVMNLYWVYLLLFLLNDWTSVEPANVPLNVPNNQTNSSTNTSILSPSPTLIATTIRSTHKTVGNPDVTGKPTNGKIPIVNLVVPLLVALLVGIAIVVAIYRQTSGRNRSATEIDEKELVPENNRQRRLRILPKSQKPSKNAQVTMETIPEETSPQMEPRFAREDGDLGLPTNGQIGSQSYKGVDLQQPPRAVIDLTPLHNSVVGGSPRVQPKLIKAVRSSEGTNAGETRNKEK